MRVKNLVAKLNKVVKDFDVNLIHNHDQLHTQLKAFLIEKELLPPRFHMRSWEITCVYKRNNENYTSEEKIIGYNRNFIKDKRCKWEDRGKFSNIKFMSEKNMGDIEVEKIGKYLIKRDLNKCVEYCKEKIIKLKAELIETEKHILELKGQK